MLLLWQMDSLENDSKRGELRASILIVLTNSKAGDSLSREDKAPSLSASKTPSPLQHHVNQSIQWWKG